MPSVVDSDGTTSPIITTSNAGVLLPKAIEGLADGSLWNDKGVVKVAPFTGDLDAGGDATLSIAAGTAPAAEAGVAKIYSKLVPTAPAESSCLFHFNNNLDDSVPGNPRMVTPGGVVPVFDSTPANVKFGTHSLKFTGDNGSGKGALAIVPSSPALLIGDANFTIDYWLKVGSGARGTSGTSYITLLDSDISNGTYGSGAGGNNVNLRLVMYQDSHPSHAGKLLFYIVQSTSDISYRFVYITGLTISDFHDWQHIAIVREGTADTKTKLYIDGVSQFSSLNGDTGRLFNNSEIAGDTDEGKYPGLAFGRHAEPGSEYADTVIGTDMWIDGLQIINGTAKWTGNFTPPGEYNAGSVSKLFCTDSDGNETQLTP